MSNRKLTKEEKEYSNLVSRNIKQTAKYLFNPRNWDFSDYLLILSNLIIIFLGILGKLSYLEIMWIYWIQGVILAFFTILKIIFIKEFSTTGTIVNGKTVETTTKGKFIVIGMFIFIFSIFQGVYFIFLMGK